MNASSILSINHILGCQPKKNTSKLLDSLREAVYAWYYSKSTKNAYCHWVKRFVHFHKLQHPKEMLEPEINAFLTHLAVEQKVSASIQNQALSVLLFLYCLVLDKEVGNLGNIICAQNPCIYLLF